METPKTKWLDYVASTHSAVVLIHQYLKDGPQPAMSGRNFTRAKRLLGVHGAGGRWTIDNAGWRERLRMVGLDPVTNEITDEVRWAHAIDYMRATETFRLEEFKQWLLDHEEPSHVPAIDVPARPHPRARKKEKGSAINERINERIRERTS